MRREGTLYARRKGRQRIGGGLGTVHLMRSLLVVQLGWGKWMLTVSYFCTLVAIIIGSVGSVWVAFVSAAVVAIFLCVAWAKSGEWLSADRDALLAERRALALNALLAERRTRSLNRAA